MQGASGLLFMGLLLVFAYVALIRPNQRRLKQHQALVSQIAPGDEVVTVGGIFGEVREVTDDYFVLEVSPGTSLRFAKQAIARKIQPEPADVPEGSDEA